MTGILVRTFGDIPSNRLKQLKKNHPEWFRGQINGKTFIMEDKGRILAYLVNLMERHGENDVQIYAIDQIWKFELPDLCVKAGKWLAKPKKGGRRVKDLLKKFDKNKLQKCQINYEKNLKEKQ